MNGAPLLPPLATPAPGVPGPAGLQSRTVPLPLPREAATYAPAGSWQRSCRNAYVTGASLKAE